MGDKKLVLNLNYLASTYGIDLDDAEVSWDGETWKLIIEGRRKGR